jgi:hypothetical protein
MLKGPFLLLMENLASSNKLEMIDRSQVVEAIVARGKDLIGNQNGRDMGFEASYVFGGNYNFNNWSRLQIFYTIRAEQIKSLLIIILQYSFR